MLTQSTASEASWNCGICWEYLLWSSSKMLFKNFFCLEVDLWLPRCFLVASSSFHVMITHQVSKSSLPFSLLGNFFSAAVTVRQRLHGPKFHLVKAINYFASGFCWWHNDSVQTNMDAVTKHASKQDPSSVSLRPSWMYSLLPEEILNNFFLHSEQTIRKKNIQGV